LGAYDLSIDRSRYYRLRLEVQGDLLRCFLDGNLMFEARDDHFPQGKAGIRTNCEAFFDRVAVTCDKLEAAAFHDRRARQRAELEELREHYPQPVLWRRLPIRLKGRTRVRKAELEGPGSTDLVLGHRDGLKAIDLDGQVLWEMFPPGGQVLTKSPPFQVYDIDGDGSPEVVVAFPDRMMVLEGPTGRLKAEAPLPRQGTFHDQPGRPISPGLVYVANFSGDETRQVVVQNGHFGVWVYDHTLRELWARPNLMYGHCFSFYDIDGDGREEFMAGHHLLRGDGQEIWRTQGDDWLLNLFHPDTIVMTDIDGDGLAEVVMTTGEGGVLFLDHEGRVTARHPQGHAQNLSVGKYRRDIEGRQVWVVNRWGSAGLRWLFDARGDLLFRFEPDNIAELGFPCNWTGDGEELAMIITSERCTGLYDAFGREVVHFTDEGWLKGADPAPSGIHRAISIDVMGDRRDEVILISEEAIWIYTQDRPFEGDRIYAPDRRWHQNALAFVSEPAWEEYPCRSVTRNRP